MYPGEADRKYQIEAIAKDITGKEAKPSGFGRM